MEEQSPYINHPGTDHSTSGDVIVGGNPDCGMRNIVIVVVILLLLYMYNENNDKSDSFQSDYDFSRSSELDAGRNSMLQLNVRGR
jgi:hypothetical protein